MKPRDLLQYTTTYIAIAWLFFMVFYFNYVVLAAWYFDTHAEFQKLSLFFAYMVAFYILCAAFTGSFLNSFMCGKFRALNIISSHWQKIDFVLKIMVFIFSIAGLIYVSPGHTHT